MPFRVCLSEDPQLPRHLPFQVVPPLCWIVKHHDILASLCSKHDIMVCKIPRSVHRLRIAHRKRPVADRPTQWLPHAVDEILRQSFECFIDVVVILHEEMASEA
jgi:hypothetical protein